MSNRIPDEKVELVRKSSDIVEVISDHVQLKKQGRQYIGLCPFHGEKSPSFSVSPDKQLYHCFGCGAGGNVFSFVMELQGLTFIEAVKQLANRSNVELPYVESKKDEGSTNRSHEQIRNAHKRAAELYHRILTLTEEGKEGRDYLLGRGFTREQMEHFQIGYAPDQWDALTTILANQGFSLDLLVEGSLLGKRESNDGYYDRFRNRVMFPIWNGQGQIIAFGGRTITNENPKYLNSSDSPIFHKSETLYGLHLARPTIRKEATVVLFEGYIDVIAAWGAGITNGVATLGTALTEEQARIMRRNAEMVVICYDADQAGMDAAFRSAKLLEQVGCTVKVARLPEGMDPDDYIRKYGAERFKVDVIGDSLTLMAFKMAFLRRGKNMQNEGVRMRYIEEVLMEISMLKRAVERDHYLRQLADEFSLSLEALKQEQFQIYRSIQKQQRNDTDRASFSRKIEPKKLLPAHQNAERLLLAHMIRDEEVAERVQDHIGGQFNIDEYQAIAAHLFAYYGEGNISDPTEFIQRLSDEKLIRIATELVMLPINEECGEEELLDYIRQIKHYPKRVMLREKEAAVRSEQNPIKAAEILMEINRMKLELNQE